jgi:pimeloyl-ACP methyl ester carboxylesterase/predicted glycosyltransferase
MRACEPDLDGYVERDGVKVFFEVFGDGAPTILLLPTWSIVHSRRWKGQVPYLARHFRVVTFDGRGNGRSDRPRTSEAYADTEFAADAIAVLDETNTDRAVIVGMSMGAGYGLRVAAEHPDRVMGAVFVAPSVGLADRGPDKPAVDFDFDADLGTDEGWAKYNANYWRRDWPGFAEWFMNRIFTEPHPTKQIEDGLSWALGTDPETMVLIEAGSYLAEPGLDRRRKQLPAALELAARVRCPCLVVSGSEDQVSHMSGGRRLAEALGCPWVLFEGSGHAPDARDPVKFNLLLRSFVEGLVPGRPEKRQWVRGRSRPKRALYISSPIGLGHAQRDVAIADELRTIHPDVQIDWLAQHPVTEVLRARGERIHPGSAFLASESAHIQSESAEHDLHAFQAIRRMDEILLANFMVFQDLVEEEHYDLWIGDEAWDVDYFLHENPDLKRAAYVWLTDFVGWLPMPDGGAREASITADYNAEMIEHIARFPRLRDRAVFVGNPEDVVPDSFGPGLPLIADWVRDHYDYAGYVTGFDAAALADRDALRAELGYGPDEKVCIVTVGGSGVGEHLLRRVMSAFPEAKRLVPDLRMVLVAGPRIDPDTLSGADGLEVRPFVHELYRHLAACDLAVVQGGLTTTMELTATRRPFLYFPLRHHFEQNFHVRHRLERHRAGRCMDFASATPERIAEAIAQEVGRAVDYREVETDGAARAAALIADLL